MAQHAFSNTGARENSGNRIPVRDPSRLRDPELLESLELFRRVSPESIELYLDKCRVMTLKAGEVLLDPEHRNEEVYVILSGRLRVYLESLDNAPLTALSVGQCAGEMSIIEDKDPSAIVVAAEDTDLMVIDHETLWGLVNSSHAFARNLLSVLSERVRSDNEMIADSIVIMKQYEHSATTDALTGLHNRYWMQDMFGRKMQRCKLANLPVCVIMLDVDYFKPFNDRYGHLAGDQALSTVAEAMRLELRPTDLLARFGGDEFVVMLPETTLEDAMHAAERVRLRVLSEEEDHHAEDDPPILTVSAGVAQMERSDSLDELLDRADVALYHAKRKGRNCVST